MKKTFYHLSEWIQVSADVTFPSNVKYFIATHGGYSCIHICKVCRFSVLCSLTMWWLFPIVYAKGDIWKWCSKKITANLCGQKWNSHSTVEARLQHQSTINVWAGVVSNCLVGLYFLPVRLKEDVSRENIWNTFPNLLDHVPLLRCMWFLHDGNSSTF